MTSKTTKIVRIQSNNSVKTKSKSQEFTYFAHSDVTLQKTFASMRWQAQLLFSLSVISLALAIADVQLTDRARSLVAVAMECTDTYLSGWNRYCGPISDGTNYRNDRNETVSSTYFRRWWDSYTSHAYGLTLGSLIIKISLTIITVTMEVTLVLYNKSEITVLRLRQYANSYVSFLKRPRIKTFISELVLCFLFLPPLFNAWLPFEFQLIVVFRVFVCGFKLLKECSELRNNRLGNVLFKLARLKLENTFLIRTHFLRHPKTVLLSVYLTVVVFFPYFVMVSEHSSDNKISYLDSCWLMAVTITNLGSGEVRPQTIPARMIVAIGSLIGVLSTALWVNVFSQHLDFPSEERRILALVELQKCRKLERDTAVRCIQAYWRQFALRKNLSKQSKTKLASLNKSVQVALWNWKRIKQECNRVRRDLETKFPTEDTLIVAKSMQRKLSNGSSEYLASPAKPFAAKPQIPHLNKEISELSSKQDKKGSYEKVRSIFQKTNRVSNFSVYGEATVAEETNNPIDTSSPPTMAQSMRSLQSLAKDATLLTAILEREEKRATQFYSSVFNQIRRLETSLQAIASHLTANKSECIDTS